jgi:hypothetical protein
MLSLYPTEELLNGATPLFGAPVAEWHRWFAWRPVRTYDGRWSWLLFLYRRQIQKHQYLYGGPDFWWQYARIPR